MFKNRKGATVLSIGITVAIILIIASAVTFNAIDTIALQKLDNMYNDIRMLKEKVNVYYLKYGKLPIGDEYTEISTIPEEILNINDGDKYYKIDVNALENLTLSTDIDDTSFFIINEQSHTIYYPKGIEYQGVTYYALQEQYSKVFSQAELDQMAAEEAERIKQLTLITEWAIPADGTLIQLPVRGNMNITVDWGDGSSTETFEQNLTATANFPTHTYTAAGSYDIKIIGSLQYFGYNNSTAPTTSNGSKDYYTFTQYVTKIKSWGNLGYSQIRFCYLY